MKAIIFDQLGIENLKMAEITLPGIEPVEKTKEAFEHLESGKAFGKIIITI